ncbi:MAG: DMT family transporter [Paracoccus sp. (in: a-proteobacteria)]|uniref:DMT family transporter n=1 Tax=Paracoccus sp. TaxID=267 RepID=UPI0039E40E30
MRKSGNLTGIVLFAGAVALFASLDATAKWLMAAGLATLQVVFLRYLGHLVATLAVTLPRTGLGVLRSINPRLQLLRSLCLLGSTGLNFVALSQLPVTTVTAVMFASPVLVTLLAVPLLGEQVSVLQFVAILLGFFGVVIIVSPWETTFDPAIFFSLGSCVCTSCYFILTRMLAREATATQQVWTSGIAVLCLAPLALMTWQAPKDGLTVLMMCMIGLFGVASHSLVTLAHRIADASVLAPVVYLQLLFSGILGWLVFDQLPGASTLTGALVVIAGGALLWLSGRRKRIAAIRTSAVSISEEKSQPK